MSPHFLAFVNFKKSATNILTTIYFCHKPLAAFLASHTTVRTHTKEQDLSNFRIPVILLSTDQSKAMNLMTRGAQCWTECLPFLEGERPAPSNTHTHTKIHPSITLSYYTIHLIRHTVSPTQSSDVLTNVSALPAVHSQLLM